MRFKKFMKSLGRYFMIAVGAGVLAAGINIFLYPYKIAPGGIAGLATIISYMINGFLPLGVLIILLNFPLFIAGLVKLGWKFMFRTLYATIIMSVVIDVTSLYMVNLGDFFFKGNETDLILFALFGGLLVGAGMGLIFRLGATTGGTDLMAELVRRSGLNVSMGTAVLIFDTLIVILAGIYFQSLLLALYAIISVIVASKTVDSILEGFNFSKGIFIISSEPEKISQRILEELGRGLTGFRGTGKFTEERKEILFCVARAKYINEIKLIVKDADPTAFVVVTNVHEVLGEGFAGFDNKIS